MCYGAHWGRFSFGSLAGLRHLVFLGSHALTVAEDVVELGTGRETTGGGNGLVAVFGMLAHEVLGCLKADVGKPCAEGLVILTVEIVAQFAPVDRYAHGEGYKSDVALAISP